MDRRERFLELRSSAPAILPSLLLCDFAHLQHEIERLESSVPALHLDVMDGVFVPNLTYGMPITAACRQSTALPLDLHLMITEPLRYVEQFYDAGADAITIHVEATEQAEATLRRIRELGAAAGLALNPATPLETIEPLLPCCDLILVMSVPAGFGGQEFDRVALDKLTALRDHLAPHCLLEVDGGINRQTVADCVHAGAELLVVGSAIFRQPDYARAVQDLRAAAK